MAKLEHILAVDADAVNRAAKYARFKFFEDGFGLNNCFDPRDVTVMCREKLELDTHYMQVIPYVVLEKDGKVLAYKRTVKGNEERLHDRLSIGLGGHIDMKDICFDQASGLLAFEQSVSRAAYRELVEEVNFAPNEDNIQSNFFIGLINDRSDEVGCVHVGVVVLIRLKPETLEFRSNEDQLEVVGFKSFDEILEAENAENWSKIVADHLRLVAWE